MFQIFLTYYYPIDMSVSAPLQMLYDGTKCQITSMTTVKPSITWCSIYIDIYIYAKHTYLLNMDA